MDTVNVKCHVCLDHEASVAIHASHWRPNRWQDYCACCADLAIAFFTLFRGSAVEFNDVGYRGGVTQADVDAAHDVLKGEDVRVSDLIG